MPEIKANTTLKGIKQSNNQQCKFKIFWHPEKNCQPFKDGKKFDYYWSWDNASQVALVIKNPLVNTGDTRDAGSILGLGRSSGKGQGNPLQYSCLENPMDRGVWWAIVWRVTKSRTWLKCLTLVGMYVRLIVCMSEGEEWRQNIDKMMANFYSKFY